MLVDCLRYKPVSKGSLAGYADFCLPELKIKVYGCTLHEKEGRRWVIPPVQAYQKKDNTTAYKAVVEFTDGRTSRDFCESAKQAIDKFLGENHCG